MSTRTRAIIALCVWTAAVHNVCLADVCEDNVLNCEDFGNHTCEIYPDWAGEHCSKFCGFCTDKTQQGVCEDSIINCENFGNTTCETYPVWAEGHCAKFCGICNDKVQQGCPESWSYFEGDHTCIKIFGEGDLEQKLPWAESRNACLAIGGDLVQIRDKEKNSFVLDLLGEQDSFLWIGMRNTAKIGFNFEYVDGSPLGTYHPWLKNNPDNMFGLEKCVTMYPKGFFSGKWNDFYCLSLMMYACSIPSNNIASTM